MGSSQLWFDFSEFTKASVPPANRSWRQVPPKELSFETAYNNPPENTFLDILFKKIELNNNHTPTKRGWKTLSRFLAVYRSKQYETVRYLLLDTSGDIVDHVAITNRIPNRAKISPDSIAQGEYFRNLARYVSENNYKIVMVHNHPSGSVFPSEDDKNITGYLLRSFKNNFAGHLILDHGSFGLYLPGKDWEVVSQKPAGYDPLVKPGRDVLFNYDLSGGLTPDTITMLRCALKIDDGDRWNSRDWVAVVFTSGRGGYKSPPLLSYVRFLSG
jgi:proteasome lid subunit RPN8/RPN11